MLLVLKLYRVALCCSRFETLIPFHDPVRNYLLSIANQMIKPIVLFVQCLKKQSSIIKVWWEYPNLVFSLGYFN